MIVGFIVVCMAFAGLAGLADFDKLLGQPAGRRFVPAIALTFDLIIVTWGLALVIWRPW